jgi:hypothetical protein
MRLHAQLTAVRAEIASLDAALNRFASDLGQFDTRLQTARVAAARALRAPACDDDTEFASVDDLDDENENDDTDVSGGDQNSAVGGGSHEQASCSGPRSRSRIPAHRASDILLLAARFARVSASPAEMLEFKWAPSGQMPHPVAEEQMRASRLHGANSRMPNSFLKNRARQFTRLRCMCDTAPWSESFRLIEIVVLLLHPF